MTREWSLLLASSGVSLRLCDASKEETILG